MEIIDSHGHVFPYLGGRAGFTRVSEHLAHCQWAMHRHSAQPVRRVKDNVIVQEETLWDPDDPSPEGKYEVNFRVGRFGRFEWTKDGVDYYIQYMPPSLQRFEVPPELLKTMMEYAGVDKAVLQCATTYGKLNYYYAMISKEFPDLFIPLAEVDEKKAHKEEQINELRNCILNLNLKGLWFRAHEACFESKYEPFWNEVRNLRIPIFWYLAPDKLFDLMKGLREWSRRYNSPSVIAQAFPLSVVKHGDKIVIPQFVRDLIEEQDIYLELAYPISQGRVEEYPYRETQKAIKQLYEMFGGGKFVWGSDAPNVERYCTYSQSLNYLREYCDFIAPQDMELILGGNIEKIFNFRK